jgi:hypothetical protein
VYRLGFLIALAAVALAAENRREEHFFDKRVAPILIKRCVGCHNPELRNGGLSLMDRESALQGGGRGPAIVPGNPQATLLVQTLQHSGDLQMPPGPRLPAKEISTLTEWVRRGAIWGAPLRAPKQ